MGTPNQEVIKEKLTDLYGNEADVKAATERMLTYRQQLAKATYDDLVKDPVLSSLLAISPEYGRILEIGVIYGVNKGFSGAMELARDPDKVKGLVFGDNAEEKSAAYAPGGEKSDRAKRFMEDVENFNL